MALLEKSCLYYIIYLSTCTFMYRLMGACDTDFRYLFVRDVFQLFIHVSYEFSWVLKCLYKTHSFLYSSSFLSTC
jgi:hypothetical protein